MRIQALITELTEAANFIATEVALNLMDGIKAQWDWAADLTNVLAQLEAIYRDGFLVDRELMAYCEWLIDAII